MIVPIMASTLCLLFWKMPAIPSPMATRSSPINPNTNKPIIIASIDSSSIPPGEELSMIPAIIKSMKIPNTVAIEINNDAMPNLECPVLSKFLISNLFALNNSNCLILKQNIVSSLNPFTRNVVWIHLCTLLIYPLVWENGLCLI